MRPLFTKILNITGVCPCAASILRMAAAVTAVSLLGGVQVQAKDSVLFEITSILNAPVSGTAGGAWVRQPRR